MSEQELPEVQPDEPEEGETAAEGVAVSTPEFAPVQPTPASGTQSPLQSVYDVSVTVTAELGRVSLPIGELLQLGEGSVIELDRPISTPVDLRAQGVLVAQGEVVVVDDCFAVRLKQVTKPDAAA